MKVLIITYYWPPAGGPGVQRWLKFVKYFQEFGVTPVVYTPENPLYPMQDDSFVSEVPDTVEIIKQPILEPYRFAQLFSKGDVKTISKGIITKQEKQTFVQKLLLYIRGNFFIPDARKYWVKPSIKYLKKYLAENQIDTVVTTGPPHSVHLIGLELQKELGVRWIADFRDPWTTIGYHKQLKLTPKSQKKHKQLESQVLNSADHITVTSFTTQKEFRQLTNQPIAVVTNGYDQEEVEEVVLDMDFSLSHIGSLLSGRNPLVLWQVLAEIIGENKAFREHFRLQLVGAVSEDVLESIQKAGLSDYLDLKGYVSHTEAILLQRRSQILLLIEIDSPDTRCIIPGKLFEYLAAKRPLLAIGPKGADIQKIIEDTEAGYFFEYHQKEALKKIIETYFEAFLNQRLVGKAKHIEKYSRKTLTATMADILKSGK